jgi:hypothetical protein
MIRPLSSHEPSNPLAGISTWLASCRIGQEPLEVRARTWFLARDEAARTLGVEPGQVELTMVPQEEASR